MTKVISIIIWGLILYPSSHAQQKTYGYKISGNGDIVSNVILIQNGFVLDSVINSQKYSGTYYFEYNNYGKLKRDINFIWNVIPVRDTTGGRPVWRNKYFPGYRDYYYNERGDVDSIAYGYWNDSLWVSDSSCGRINYSNDGKVILEVYSSKGIPYKFVGNSYDSSGNLIMSMRSNSVYYSGAFHIEDTSYISFEYDSQNRLVLRKTLNPISWNRIDQTIYEYDSSGNVSWFPRAIYTRNTGDSITYDTAYSEKTYLRFDETGKVLDGRHWNGYYDLSNMWHWNDDGDLLFSYDQYNRILNAEDAMFYYNTDGNLDTLITRGFNPAFFGATLVDSYGNRITLSDYSGYNIFYYSKLVTGVEKINVNVKTYALSQNYPNPFNPATTITYSLPKSSSVTLKIYDVLGREIATLVNEKKNIGTYNVTWNAQNVPSGVYFYKLIAGEYSKANKMILLK